MRTLKFLLEKEFKQIIRDKMILRMIVIMPIMQLIILPFAANFEMKNINLAVVDADRSVVSQRLTDKIASSGYFSLTDSPSGHNETRQMLNNNSADITLEFPLRMEKDLQRENKADVLIEANAVNGMKAGLGTAYLSSIINQFNMEQSSVEPPIITQVKTTNLFNPHLDYKAYMVPGIMAFLLTMVGAFLSALNIVSEKEKGTIEQINVTPVSKFSFMLSKMIPFWVIGLVIITLGMFVTRLIYGYAPVGSIGVIYLFAFLYLIALTGLGLAVSSISSTQQQAMLTMFFINMIFALMSGLFTPINSMPEWAQTITLLNPIRYFVEFMRMIYLNGGHLADFGLHFIAVILFGIAFNILAVAGYRKKS